jgi:glutamine synthetase
VPLPASLDEALEALDGDERARVWLPPVMYESYVAVKRAEISLVEGLDPAEACRMYAGAY